MNVKQSSNPKKNEQVVRQLIILFQFSLQKGLAKGGKKGAKKKVIDPFTRKDWYDIKAPSMFKVRDVGKTLVNRTQGTKLASDGLKTRVYEVSLADLQNEPVSVALIAQIVVESL